MSPDENDEGFVVQPAGGATPPELLPWPDYEQQTEAAIVAVVQLLTAQAQQVIDTLAEVKAYEFAHTRRADIMDATKDSNLAVGEFTSKWTSKWHGLFLGRWDGKPEDLTD